MILTRSDFDDSKKDKKPKPKDGVKVRTVTMIIGIAPTTTHPPP